MLDLSPFSSLARSLDPEEILVFLGIYYEKIAVRVSEVGARVVSHVGDALIILIETTCPSFGNAAAKAIDLAFDLLARVDREFGPEVGAKVSIAWGALAEGQLERGREVVGTPLTVLFRLEDAAPRGTIVLSRTLYRAAMPYRDTVRDEEMPFPIEFPETPNEEYIALNCALETPELCLSRTTAAIAALDGAATVLSRVGAVLVFAVPLLDHTHSIYPVYLALLLLTTVGLGYVLVPRTAREDYGGDERSPTFYRDVPPTLTEFAHISVSHEELERDAQQQARILGRIADKKRRGVRWAIVFFSTALVALGCLIVEMDRHRSEDCPRGNFGPQLGESRVHSWGRDSE